MLSSTLENDVIIGGVFLEKSVQLDIKDLDAEWVYLLITARKLGLTIEEIRRFFYEQQSNLNEHQ
jgi:hypothetical protein